MIGVYNAYVKGEYEVIVEGNQKEVMVTEGGSFVALSHDILCFVTVIIFLILMQVL